MSRIATAAHALSRLPIRASLACALPLMLTLTAPVAATEPQASPILTADGTRHGSVSVRDTASGVLLRIEATGLPPGWHGMHFHEKGDCSSAGFTSAGGHVHATKPVVHGFLVPGANDAGDLPNLFVRADGSATVELHSTLVSMTGAGGRPALNDADGAALVIHAEPDDYRTQPIGGAGARIACAVLH